MTPSIPPAPSTLRIILTGATGMVGEGVLLECLNHPAVEHILMVNRRHFDLQHPKLEELLVPDFLHLEQVAPQLSGYNTCFFCAGISSFRMSEADYTRVTYDTTLAFARTLAELNPGMTFLYVSGAQTDSSEKGRIMWARVKGRTENALTRLPFRQVYNFRPGFMKAIPGQRNLKSAYRLIGWMYPLLRRLLPNQVSTLQQVARAMINAVLQNYPDHILEVKQINALSGIPG